MGKKKFLTLYLILFRRMTTVTSWMPGVSNILRFSNIGTGCIIISDADLIISFADLDPSGSKLICGIRINISDPELELDPTFGIYIKL